MKAVWTLLLLLLCAGLKAQRATDQLFYESAKSQCELKYSGERRAIENRRFSAIAQLREKYPANAFGQYPNEYRIASDQVDSNYKSESDQLDRQINQCINNQVQQAKTDWQKLQQQLQEKLKREKEEHEAAIKKQEKEKQRAAEIEAARKKREEINREKLQEEARKLEAQRQRIKQNNPTNSMNTGFELANSNNAIAKDMQDNMNAVSTAGERSSVNGGTQIPKTPTHQNNYKKLNIGQGKWKDNNGLESTIIKEENTPQNNNESLLTNNPNDSNNNEKK